MPLILTVLIILTNETVTQLCRGKDTLFILTISLHLTFTDIQFMKEGGSHLHIGDFVVVWFN
jgi:hypothetical protein